jgi:hypothetical protein
MTFEATKDAWQKRAAMMTRTRLVIFEVACIRTNQLDEYNELLQYSCKVQSVD